MQSLGWARLSISYRRKRIEALTKALERYEADFADGRLFTARIVLRATYATLLGVFFVTLLLLSWVVSVPDATRCEFHGNCPELYGKIALSFHEWISLPFTTLATLVLGFFFIAWSNLAVQVTPEKCRNRLKERITSLQDRA
jgi:hypothetical protein